MRTAPVHETLRARTLDGVEVRARLTAPAPEAPGGALRATILCLPAMGVTATYYQGLADALAVAGLATACLDLRGNGDSDVPIRRGTTFGYWHHVLDVRAAAAALAERFPGVPQVALGHSLGGHLGALLLATTPRGPTSGLALVAAGTNFWRNWPVPEALRVLAGTQTALAVAFALGYFPGDRFGFGGTQSLGVIRDWAALCRRGCFDIRGADRDLEAALARVTAPVLSLSLAGDWYSPRRAADHLVGKLTAAPVERRHVTLPDAPHAKSPHFRWTRHPEAILPPLQDWLERVVFAR